MARIRDHFIGEVDHGILDDVMHNGVPDAPVVMGLRWVGMTVEPPPRTLVYQIPPATNPTDMGRVTCQQITGGVNLGIDGIPGVCRMGPLHHVIDAERRSVGDDQITGRECRPQRI
jgi:hypothetical protein